MLLERLFQNLALRVEPFAVCEVSTGWRLRMDALEWVTLHFVLQGHGLLRTGAGQPQELGTNTLAVVPQRRGHALWSGPGAARESQAATSDTDPSGLLHLVAGREGDRELRVACGRLQAVYASGLGLFDLLHDVIVLDFSDSEQMASAFARMLAESARPSPGSVPMLTALMNECLVLIFRRLCDTPDCKLPWLNALEEPRMSAVLERVLEHPEHQHSLESLAEQARMSRSAFAHEFSERFGRSPMAFVRDVRLRRGAELLRGTSLPVDAVARRVGFSSRSHFSRAFRGYFGQAPSEFRTAGHGKAHDRNIAAVG